MMVFAAPLELAHVSQSPQAAFRPVWRSTAQHRPVEIQGQKRGIRENVLNTPFSLLVDNKHCKYYINNNK